MCSIQDPAAIEPGLPAASSATPYSDRRGSILLLPERTKSCELEGPQDRTKPRERVRLDRVPQQRDARRSRRLLDVRLVPFVRASRMATTGGRRSSSTYTSPIIVPRARCAIHHAHDGEIAPVVNSRSSGVLIGMNTYRCSAQSAAP